MKISVFDKSADWYFKGWNMHSFMAEREIIKSEKSKLGSWQWFVKTLMSVLSTVYVGLRGLPALNQCCNQEFLNTHCNIVLLLCIIKGKKTAVTTVENVSFDQVSQLLQG